MQRNSMFTHHEFSLAEVLQSPHDFHWCSSCGDGNKMEVGLRRISDKAEGICTIRGLKDFDIPTFTLFNLALCYHNNHELSVGINTFMSVFFHAVRNADPETQARFLRLFYGNTSYGQLHNISPYVAQLFMRFLLDDREHLWNDTQPNFRRLYKAPDVVLQYADFLARQQTEFPYELLKTVNLVDTYDLTPYSQMSPSLRCPMKVEGSFGLRNGNHNIFGFASCRMKNNKLNTKDLQDLRNLVLKVEHPNESARYPVPETAPWAGQESLLACLKMFEAMRPYHPEETRVFLALRIKDNALLDRLLISNVRATYYIGPDADAEKLPIDCNSKSEYFVSLPDGSNFAWTESLSKYIEKYNIVPSREFLMLYESLLDYGKNYFLESAKQLERYLNEHPLVLEADNAKPAMNFKSP